MAAEESHLNQFIQLHSSALQKHIISQLNEFKTTEMKIDC